MTADPYGDPDLVALYDADNPDGADHDYYRALAKSIDARKIIDLGCGTGLLTRTLVAPGCSVTGIDPSRTMLGWARRQPGAERVTWIEGDTTVIEPTGDVDLVISTGNAIMHLDGGELSTALHRISQALRPGGLVAFESRNPAARQWEEWTREATYGQRETHLGRLAEWIEVTDVTGERVSFDAHNVMPDGEDRVSTTVLYFRDVESFQDALRAAGFEVPDISGGWRGEEVTPTSRLFVLRARRR